MRLWEIGVGLIGGNPLALAQLDELLKEAFVEPIIENVTRRPDFLHVLQRGLFDASGAQIPIPEALVWSDLTGQPEGKMIYFHTDL